MPEDEVVAMTRKGKQVLNVGAGDEAAVVAPADGDSVAVIGDNRKLLLFPLDGAARDDARQGCAPATLQGRRPRRCQDLHKEGGLPYINSAARSFILDDLRDWWGQRAQAGRLPPKGFPKSGLRRQVLSLLVCHCRSAGRPSAPSRCG